MNNFWIWLIGGLIPCYFNLQKKEGEKTFEVRALFWSILICLYDNGNYQWTMRCELIKWLRKLPLR